MVSCAFAASEGVEAAAILVVVDLPAGVTLRQNLFRPGRACVCGSVGIGSAPDDAHDDPDPAAQNATVSSGMTNHQPPQPSFHHITSQPPKDCQVPILGTLLSGS
jgi:hypothetical protein